MPFQHCRGYEVKQRLVNQYNITPLSYIKLLPNQDKQGCCGVLRDKYYVFEYRNKINANEKGSFFVGYDCGEQFLDLLNIDKNRYKLFNPLATENNGGGLGGGGGGAGNAPQRDQLNQEVYNAINLICVAWNTLPKNSIQSILNFVRNPNSRRTDDWTIKTVNTLISHDYHNRTLSQIVQDLSDEYNLRNFSFELMNETIERLQENEDVENHIL